LFSVGEFQMAAYTKEFLIDAFMSRYIKVLSIEELLSLEELAVKFYDKVGRDKFRVYASLDADAIKQYKLST
jgi:hypothetical protein